MNGARLWGLVATATILPIAAGSCGTDGAASETLPPIVTVSTTTTILITTTTVQKFYIVKRGDTLGKIAKAFQVRLADLQAINGITNPDDIQAGQELKIPSGVQVFTSLPTPDTTPTTT